MASKPSNHDFFDHGNGFNRPTKTEMRKAKRLLKTAKQTARHGAPLTPKTDAQREFLDCIKDNDVVLACGAAGVGKTYVAARYALQELMSGNFEKIIVTRPMVEVSGEKLGFLPGDIKAKTDPWMIPIFDAFCDGASKTTVETMMKAGQIEFAPFANIRGRTFRGAFILADESQNLTVEQFKVLITRVGEDSKIIVSGDLRQSDIRGRNGLSYAIDLAERADIDCEIFEFDDSDVVRSKIAAQWVMAFSTHGDN